MARGEGRGEERSEKPRSRRSRAPDRHARMHHGMHARAPSLLASGLDFSPLPRWQLDLTDSSPSHGFIRPAASC